MTMKRSLTIVSALALAGCLAAEGPEAPQVGGPAPAYAATTLQGDTVSLESLRGEVVLLNFWATWCGPCRFETPFLQQLSEEYGDRDFNIVGVSMDTGDAADQIAMFVEEYGVTYTILHDPQMRGMELYQILGLPATFLLDREGTLTWMKYGPVGETDTAFFQAIEDALK
jgi:cytochrome c biogenesis protein CcmG, thiol:disulfide interchange protein DsbE